MHQEGVHFKTEVQHVHFKVNIPLLIANDIWDKSFNDDAGTRGWVPILPQTSS